MNLLSINIKGIGGEDKADWIRGIKHNEGISFMLIQESQTVGVLESVVKKYWGSSTFGWALAEPVGRSGGLISIWDPMVFVKNDCYCHGNFLVVKGKIKGYNDWAFVVNIYAPQGVKEKQTIWNKITELKSREKGMWIIAGDFNSVRFREERKGSKFNNTCARVFNEFIDEAELVEYPMKGSCFTYLMEGEKGKKLSKIDRFLVGVEVMDEWPDAMCQTLPRKFSDHNPVILLMKECNFGPKPFSVFNSWLERDGFEEVVVKAVETAKCFGPPEVRLRMKLKYTRSRIKKMER